MGLSGLGGLGSNAQPTPPIQGLSGLGSSHKVSLKKGEKVSLKKAAQDIGISSSLSHIHVGLGWDINQFDGKDFDLDVFVFMIKGDGKVRDTKDFIFYGNKISKDSEIQLSEDNQTGKGQGDDETVMVDLEKVSSEIEKIVFSITIYEGKERGQNFGQVSNAFVRVVDRETQKEILRYDLSEDFSLETAVVSAELYRHHGEWKFNAVGSGFKDGLAALCACYGVDAE